MTQLSTSLPLSVFIITLNEEDRIETAIRSVVDWVDEVIVVDSGSEDRTKALAEACGAKVFHNDWPGYGKQKRHGEDLCRNDWVLNLDADEEITPQLRDEIIAQFENGHTADVYNMKLVTIFAGETHARRGARGNWYYRLYNKTLTRFSESPVHDAVEPGPDVRKGELKNVINHRSMRSIEWAVEKMNRYSSWQRDDMLERGRKLATWRLLTEFPVSFLKSYLMRKNFLHGYWGIIDSHNFAYSRFLRVAKMYEESVSEKPNRK